MTTLRRRSAERGYTVVEVLAAMTLFAIGAAGVISMQVVTIKGGEDARRFDIATNIAQQWGSRLQRDAMMWTSPNATSTGYNVDKTIWIAPMVSAAGVPTTTGERPWHSPILPSTPPTGGTATTFTSANDLFGHDVAPGDATRIFCTQIRETWMVAPPALGALLRVEIRVVWSRLEAQPIGVCDDPGTATAVDATPNSYHFVYVTTGLRENTSQ